MILVIVSTIFTVGGVLLTIITLLLQLYLSRTSYTELLLRAVLAELQGHGRLLTDIRDKLP